jgi:DNA-binding response OmpR family regulator
VGETQASGRLVLVVDDHAPLRTVCRLSLEAAGFRVAEAADGDEALESIAAERPDVILLDVMLPRVSGWHVAATLLEQRIGDNIPIIFITARTGQPDRVRAFELGARDYLTKPFDPSILPDVIATVVDEIERGERAPEFAETLGALRAERVLASRSQPQ